MKFVKFTETANRDLREIAFWLAEQSGDREVALRFIDGIRNRVLQLENFPQSGTFPSDRVLRSLGYRFLTYGEYLLFYTVDETAGTVYVEAVFNSKKDYARVLKKML